jgi:hypothetical protein
MLEERDWKNLVVIWKLKIKVLLDQNQQLGSKMLFHYNWDLESKMLLHQNQKLMNQVINVGWKHIKV